MNSGKYPILAREGWMHVALAVGAAAITHYYLGWLWASPLWVVSLFVLQFFRDPPRAVPASPTAILAPADGRVIVLDEVEDPYLKRPSRRISIFMNVFNVHSNKSPIAGKVMERWYNKGKFFNAALDKASRDNERNALWIRTDAGQDVVVVQVAGLIARRILCYVQSGERIAQGQRYGFIRFGSRLDVYLPTTAQFQVSLGDKVHATTDVIARLAQ